MRAIVSRESERPGRIWGDDFGSVSTLFSYPLGKTPTEGNPNEQLPRLVAAIATIEQDFTIFSQFPERTRYHLLLSGETELTVAGTVIALSGIFPRHIFPGDVVTTCRLRRAPAVAFNLVVAKGIVVEKLQPLTIAGAATLDLANSIARPAEGQAEQEGVEILYCIAGSSKAGRLAATLPGSEISTELFPGDALIFHYQKDGFQPERLIFDGSGVLLHSVTTVHFPSS